MSERKLNILLVEDNFGDELLIKEALKSSNCGSHLSVVRDGICALSYLRREGGHSHSSRPDIIFLDVNIPKKSGIEVLAEIKSDQSLNSIRVLMLTTSDSYRDKARCLDLKADAYIRKPVDLEDFLKVIKTTENHYINKLIEPDVEGSDGADFNLESTPSTSKREAS